MLNDTHEPLPRREIALSANPKDSQLGCRELTDLFALRPNSAIAADDNEPSAGNGRNPFGIGYTEWALRYEWMADMDRVSTGCSERLTQAQSALINVEAEITWICRHLKGSLR